MDMLLSKQNDKKRMCLKMTYELFISYLFIKYKLLYQYCKSYDCMIQFVLLLLYISMCAVNTWYIIFCLKTTVF